MFAGNYFGQPYFAQGSARLAATPLAAVLSCSMSLAATVDQPVAIAAAAEVRVAVQVPRSQPYRLSWPWTAQGVSDADEMFQILFDEIRNGAISLESLGGVVRTNQGGTNKMSWTAGSVVFAATGGTALAEDNANFYWDQTAKQLKVVGSLVSPLIIGGASTTSSLTLRATSGVSAAGADIIFQVGTSGAVEAARILTSGNIGIGQTSPTAALHLKAGTAAASSAPIKLTSGSVLSAPETGAIEFLTDDLFATITTGAARKAFVLDDGARLTSGRVPFATTNGRLVDDADLTFAVDTLTATKLVTTALTDSGLTSGRVPFASTGGLLTDDADLTFSVDTLTVTKFIAGGGGEIGTGPTGGNKGTGTLNIKTGLYMNGSQVFDSTANGTFATTANFSWNTKAFDTVYQAASDGFVVAYWISGTGSIAGGDTVTVSSDSNTSPTTVRAKQANEVATTLLQWIGSVMIPVRRNDYYIVQRSTTDVNGTAGAVWWVPVGTAG